MSEFFREIVNLSNQQELERNKVFEAKVNKYLSTIEAKLRNKITRNIRYRKIEVKEPLNVAKLEALYRVCNKLKEEGFSVSEWTSPYEWTCPYGSKVFMIISW